MKANMDTIQFESRREIEDVMVILQEWKKEHQVDSKAEIAEELLQKLDYMHMCW